MYTHVYYNQLKNTENTFKKREKTKLTVLDSERIEFLDWF